MIRLLVVDDHPIARAGLVELLRSFPSMQVVGEAVNAADGADLYLKLRPDVLIVDIRLPGVSGLHMIRSLMHVDPRLRSVVLTSSDSDSAIEAAFRVGALAFLNKTVGSAELLRAIECVAQGASYMSEEVRRRAARSLSAGLTPREVEVLGHLVNGESNQQIASQLGVSLFTIKNHVKAVLNKTGATDRADIIRMAHQSGFVDFIDL
jgi:DNA-binding NarL/FixJ family response regulator